MSTQLDKVLDQMGVGRPSYPRWVTPHPSWRQSGGEGPAVRWISGSTDTFQVLVNDEQEEARAGAEAGRATRELLNASSKCCA